jgi:AraC-like DNA-binding protein
MTPAVFDTRLLPMTGQFQGWRAWNLPLLEVMSQGPTGDGFPAQNRVWKLEEGLLVARVTAPAACTVRSSRLLRQLPVDHWVVSHMLRGTASMETPRGPAEVRAGRTFIWSLGQPSSSKHSQVDRVDLVLSRDTFHDITPLLDVATGSVLDSTLSRSLGDFLMTLVRRLPCLPDADAPLLRVAVGKLIAACIAPSAERFDPARELIDVGRLEKVRQTVRSHLQSPFLGPRMLSRQVGMSRSNLYRLLANEGGVMSYVQRRRLAEARSRLSNKRNIQSITSMAHDLGFADLSSFTRAFRTMFGVSPGEMRAAGTELGAPSARSAQTYTCFADLLRQPMPGQPTFGEQMVKSAAVARISATMQ